MHNVVPTGTNVSPSSLGMRRSTLLRRTTFPFSSLEVVCVCFVSLTLAKMSHRLGTGTKLKCRVCAGPENEKMHLGHTSEALVYFPGQLVAR